MKRKSNDQVARDIEIGRRIELLMFNKNFDAAQLAALLERKVNSISGYKSGKTSLSDLQLSLICEHFNIDKDYFDISKNVNDITQGKAPPEIHEKTSDFILSELQRWKEVAEAMKATNMELIHQVTGLIETTKKNADSIHVHAEAAMKASSTNDNLSYTVRKNADYAILKEENIRQREEEMRREKELFLEKEEFWKEQLAHITKAINESNKEGEVLGKEGRPTG